MAGTQGFEPVRRRYGVATCEPQFSLLNFRTADWRAIRPGEIVSCRRMRSAGTGSAKAIYDPLWRTDSVRITSAR